MERSRTRILGLGLSAVLLAMLAGCECSSTPGEVLDTGALDGGGDGGPRPDTGPRPDANADTGPMVDAGPMRCGNAMVEGLEECDDGNTDPDDGCSATCMIECGDGTVSGDELCDTAIATGDPGACPTSCDDGMSCTTDSLDGSDCAQQCVHGDITAAADDDGCCPTGEDATTDNDCPGICGNGVVEAGETCDTGIATGAGSCPATCDDGVACTTDVTAGSACTIACTNTPITTAMGGDMCCPAGATPATDSDCMGCGDGVVVAPETCDTGIATGPGSCPTTCNDGMACTADMLVSGGTCSAACTSTPIAAGPMDTCCPTGATIGTDPDCAARCGDGIVTPPEACDGGAGCTPTCTISTTLTAFRFTDMDIRDPHLFASLPFLGCNDITDGSIFGMPLVNPRIQTAITTDADMPADGELDLSITHVFAPLLQTPGMSTPTFLTFPDCTAPMSSTMCTLPAGAPRTAATAMNLAAGMTCLGPLAGTTGSASPTATYSPAITAAGGAAGGACYVANAGTVSFVLAGITITLSEASIGGEWMGTPATQIRNGLIRGFLSETDANATIIPAGTTGIASVDGQPISRLLRGGMGSCSRPSPAIGDVDTSVVTGARGWYFYLNFAAAARPYTEL